MGAFAAAEARMLGRVYATLGEAATYTDRDAVPTACTVLVERDLSRYGEVAQVNLKTAVLSVRVAEVPLAPRRGDTFVLGSVTLVVDSLQGSDALEHRVFVA